jgi:hypothetical protein
MRRLLMTVAITVAVISPAMSREVVLSCTFVQGQGTAVVKVDFDTSILTLSSSSGSAKYRARITPDVISWAADTVTPAVYYSINRFTLETTRVDANALQFSGHCSEVGKRLGE